VNTAISLNEFLDKSVAPGLVRFALPQGFLRVRQSGR
jgi:hypothetical protein